MTARLALVGHPVAHSRSPAMMNAAFRALGLDAIYERRDTPPGALDATLAALWDDGYLGVNITVPWKAAVRVAVQSVDEIAERCGAVNTLTRAPDGFHGTNTDVPGFARAVLEAGTSLAAHRVVVIGAGGAARAVVLAAQTAGAESVTVLARDVRKARGLGRASAFGSFDARAAVAASTLLVQATPCGMSGGPPGESIVAAVDLARCAPATLAIDLVYSPRMTPWILSARSAGLRVLDGVGIGMLVHQGAEAFESWFGCAAPIDVMRAAVLRAD